MNSETPSPPISDPQPSVPEAKVEKVRKPRKTKAEKEQEEVRKHEPETPLKPGEKKITWPFPTHLYLAPIAEEKKFPAPCLHPEHDPGGLLYVATGTFYKHTCPACKAVKMVAGEEAHF